VEDGRRAGSLLSVAEDSLVEEDSREVAADILASADIRVEPADSQVADTRQEDNPAVGVDNLVEAEDSPVEADTRQGDSPAVADSPVAVADIQVVGVDNNLPAEEAHRRRSYRTGRRTCFPG
jgi:hypothetical protein